tara:strand:+ start:17919 stop:18077 length:159 start_codon:yes stop_codon:yes gene_type:complete
MDRINKIMEEGGAGDWGTDKARAKLQNDTPNVKVKRKNKLKTFKEFKDQKNK